MILTACNFFITFCKKLGKKILGFIGNPFKRITIFVVFFIFFLMLIYIGFSPLISFLNMNHVFFASWAFSILLAGYLCFLLSPEIPYQFKDDSVFRKVWEKIPKNKEALLEWVNYAPDKTDEKKTLDKNPDDLSENEKFEYEKILQIRDLDNKLLWTRVNMLIVFQGVLLGAFIAGFKELYAQHQALLIFIIGTGFFSSLVLYCVAKGSSYWITHWEELLVNKEKSLSGKISIFYPDHHANDLQFKYYQKKKGYVSTRDWIVAFTMLLPIVWIIILVSFIP